MKKIKTYKVTVEMVKRGVKQEINNTQKAKTKTEAILLTGSWIEFNEDIFEISEINKIKVKEI